MRRRDFVTILGLALLGGAATLWRNFASLLQPRFNAHSAQTVKVITDLMFPGDALPGAIALKIHDRIFAMEDLHETMAYGVAWLDSWARSNGVSDFLALDESKKSAAIDAAFASDTEDASQFATILRYHAGLTYYSDPVIKAAFAYTAPPQPEGFPDFQDRPQ